MAVTDIGSVARIDRREAPNLARDEYTRLAALASQLAPDEWGRPTDCPEWTVREVIAHVTGTMAGTSLREGARQRKVTGQRMQSSGRTFLDEMNELHIDDRRGLADNALATEMHDRIEPAVSGRAPAEGLLTTPGVF